MKRSPCGRYLATCVLLVSGCSSLSGSWRTVEVEPSWARAPVETITFDEHNRYTATRRDDGKTRTDTGEYRWNGFTLVLRPPREPPRTYPARLRLDGRLVVSSAERAEAIVATLERTP